MEEEFSQVVAADSMCSDDSAVVQKQTGGLERSRNLGMGWDDQQSIGSEVLCLSGPLYSPCLKAMIGEVDHVAGPSIRRSRR